VIVGALVHWSIGLELPTALLFGAIVATTDPIAVLAIFKRLGAPHELEVLIEGESLFNHGTAVVLARVLLGAALAGTFDLTAACWTLRWWSAAGCCWACAPAHCSRG
jgi:CPA1 family monovalent cation:H+ antiporter